MAGRFGGALLVIRLFAGFLSLFLSASLLAGLFFLRGESPVSLILGGTLAMVYGMAGLMFLRGIFRRLSERLRSSGAGEEREPIYGFAALLVAGLGSTMGISMLTVLPYAVRSYSAAATLAAVALSGSVSLALAWAYGQMARRSAEEGRRAVGGPAFVKSAYGIGAAYFLTRLSMWIGTTALTAFNMLMSAWFLIHYLPGILGGLGVSGAPLGAAVAGIGSGVFLWVYFLFRYEGKKRRAVASAQLVLISAFLALLVVSIVLFASRAPSPPLESLGGGVGPVDVIFVTGYIYLVLFGFQEVQALYEESRPEVVLPLVGRVGRERYVGWAMSLTVLISTAMFAAYTLTVSPFDLSGVIPPLEISIRMGAGPTVVNSALILLAALTTLTPSYMAAKRHLEELGRDGLIPPGLTGYSWLFTLAVAVFMAMLDPDVLVGVADTGILIALAVIAVSDVQLRRGEASRGEVVRDLWVSLTCAVVLASFYLIEPDTFVMGITFLMMSWFAFAVLRLGGGVDLFMAIMTFVAYQVVERIGLSQILPGMWVTQRVGTVLLLLSAVYLVEALPRLRAWDIWYDFLSYLEAAAGAVRTLFYPIWSGMADRLERARIRERRYEIINAALRLEEIREKNPDLYERLEKVVKKDLERLLEE